jgi:predicted Rossmann-fold nucleotide-binding protein
MSRNHINVLASDALIVLPGGPGTASETELAARYGKPIVVFLEEADPVPGLSAAVPVARTIGEVEEFLRSALRLS